MMSLHFLTANPAYIMLALLPPLYLIGVILRLLASSAPKILHILRTASDQHVILPYPPTERFNSIFTVICSLAMLGTKHLGFGPKLGTVQADGTVHLPALSITAPVSITSDNVKAYNRAIRTIFSKPEAANPVPIPSPLLLLAPLTTPLLPSLLLLKSNPIKPLGSVNVRNVFVFHSPSLLHRAGQKDSQNNQGLISEAKTGGEMLGRRMKRGIEYDTVITVKPDAEPFKPIFTFTFTTLALLRLPSSNPLFQLQAPLSDQEPAWSVDSLRLILPSSSAPKPWAALSRDYNPIHISPLLAKLFGFKRNIAHGNMILAMVMERAIDSLEREDGSKEAQWRAELGRLWAGDRPSWLIVNFRRPVFVPSATKLRWAKGRVQVYEEVDNAGGVAGKRDTDAQAKDGVRVLVDIRAGKGTEPPA